MARVIYKVTSKKATELITKELKRKNRYIPKVTKALKKVFPEAMDITYREDNWDGSLVPRALILDPTYLKKLSSTDLNKWKNVGEVWHNGKYTRTYWPKRNTKEGKEFSKTLRAVMSSEKFFQGKDIAKILDYKPKNKVSEISHDKIRITTLQFGYVKNKDKTYTFVFGGFPGYKPPRGVQELKTSEFNKIFGEK